MNEVRGWFPAPGWNFAGKLFASVCVATIAANANAFEGTIDLVTTQDGATTSLRYTVSVDFLRIEVLAGVVPQAINVANRKSGVLTIIYPNNHSFVRLKPPAVSSASTPTGLPATPAPADGLRPGPAPPGPGRPGAPSAPIPSMEKDELRATGKKLEILGLRCEQFEIKQRGETMEIWATDSLIPFQPYLRNQPRQFGPRLLGERWTKLLGGTKLFPVRAILKNDSGAESFGFEMKAVTPGKIADLDGKLFQPPPGYNEVQPLPF